MGPMLSKEKNPRSDPLNEQDVVTAHTEPDLGGGKSASATDKQQPCDSEKVLRAFRCRSNSTTSITREIQFPSEHARRTSNVGDCHAEDQDDAENPPYVDDNVGDAEQLPITMNSLFSEGTETDYYSHGGANKSNQKGKSRRQRLSISQTTMAKLENEIAERKETADSWRTHASQIVQELESSNAQLRSMKHTNDWLLSEALDPASYWRASSKSLDVQIKTKVIELDRFRVKRMSLEDVKQDYEREAEALLMLENDTDAEAVDWIHEEVLAPTTSDGVELRDKLLQIESKVGQVKATLQELILECARTENELFGLREKRRKLRIEVEEKHVLEAAMEKLETELDKALIKLDEIRIENQELRIENGAVDILRREVNVLKTVNKELTREKVENSQKIQELVQEKGAMRAEYGFDVQYS